MKEVISGKAIVQPKYLWFLILSYSMIIATANWFDGRLIELFGLVISPGTLIFPLSFLISDIITEVYGYKHARRAIWSALLFNILIIGYGHLLVSLPSPSFATNNECFNKLINTDSRIILGSIVAYMLCEPVNSYIVAKMKVLMNGAYVGLRFVLSTIVAASIDTIIFVLIAFYGMYSFSDVVDLIINVCAIKILIEILGLPLSVSLSKYIKRQEQLDMYDDLTDFSLFSMDADYSKQQNRF
ncbi:queuosine precursor transporter [Zooshikella harenae]|uniref:Probable queuosine precursor transporter n=1 Tax=Zooshikella harenae TaxID=2827238 RepID=A0ABS5ZI32_9GAMM|nr:queuosine precursor transporter [Zooshikella harenae]MBU2712936.1 queuosine precursor transporter [Zooshikella harenae]